MGWTVTEDICCFRKTDLGDLERSKTRPGKLIRRLLRYLNMNLKRWGKWGGKDAGKRL